MGKHGNESRNIGGWRLPRCVLICLNNRSRKSRRNCRSCFSFCEDFFFFIDLFFVVKLIFIQLNFFSLYWVNFLFGRVVFPQSSYFFPCGVVIFPSWSYLFFFLLSSYLITFIFLSRYLLPSLWCIVFSLSLTFFFPSTYLFPFLFLF